jgi:hypothetical protein
MKSALLTAVRRQSLAFSLLALFVVVTPAHAASIPVQNGGFEGLLQPGVSAGFGSLYPSQQVAGWTTSGYNFVFTPGTADTTGANGQYGNLTLWGPNNGGAAGNNLPASSPDGGNYLALDGAYEVGGVSQTVHGLTPGQAVAVTFYFAGAQQAGYTGDTTEQLKVSLGSEDQYTAVLNDPSHGFTGWRSVTMTFTPTSSSEVLTFLAIGTPNGVPPMSLLDGVTVSSISQTPEPSSLALMITGFAGMSGVVRNRVKKNAK